jgi:diguanylate cyclase
MTPNLFNDDLTGLMTQKAFRENLSTALLAARAKRPEEPLAVGFIDIDKFLSVNETYGHAGGDALLQEVAVSFQEAIAEKGFVARYGGDEFAFLLPGLEREGAFLLLERMRQAVNQIKISLANGMQVQGQTISAGVAAFPVDGRTETELLRKADQALYRAKQAGRNQVRLAYEEKLTPKTAHFTETQLERLSLLAKAHAATDADMLREALDDLLTKYGVNDIES